MTEIKGRAAIYCRISRDDTGDEAKVGRQEDLCRQLAERLSLTVTGVYRDNDIGASDRTGAKRRPEYNQLLEDTRNGQYTHILAYSNSRLTRRLRELEDLIQLHERTNVIIQTVVAGQDDLSTSDGRMVARIKASVDAAESDRISERQLATFRHNALAGKPKIQRQRPFGWEEDQVTLRPAEADLIRDAVERIKQGHRLTEIARLWEENGVLTAAGRSEWNTSTLKKVVTGWRTAGIRTYRREPLRDSDGEYVRALWEPIISLEDREIALEMLEKFARKKKNKKDWVLSGLLQCGECGAPLYGQLPSGQRTVPTYACKRSCVAISADRLEEHLKKEAIRRRAELLSVPEGTAKPGEPQEWPDEEKLAKVKRQIKDFFEDIKEGLVDKRLAYPQIAELSKDQDRLEKERVRFYSSGRRVATHRKSERSTSEFLADLLKVLPTEAELEKDLASFLRAALSMAVIKKGLRGRAGWSAEAFKDRVDILWVEDERDEYLREYEENNRARLVLEKHLERRRDKASWEG